MGTLVSFGTWETIFREIFFKVHKSQWRFGAFTLSFLNLMSTVYWLMALWYRLKLKPVSMIISRSVPTRHVTSVPKHMTNHNTAQNWIRGVLHLLVLIQGTMISGKRTQKYKISRESSQLMVQKLHWVPRCIPGEYLCSTLWWCHLSPQATLLAVLSTHFL